VSPRSPLLVRGRNGQLRSRGGHLMGVFLVNSRYVFWAGYPHQASCKQPNGSLYKLSFHWGNERRVMVYVI
jgi:hypothetical protein